MLYYEILWYIMVYHDILWYIVINYDILWYIIINCGISWYIMIYIVKYYDMLWYQYLINDDHKMVEHFQPVGDPNWLLQRQQHVTGAPGAWCVPMIFMVSFCRREILIGLFMFFLERNVFLLAFTFTLSWSISCFANQNLPTSRLEIHGNSFHIPSPTPTSHHLGPRQGAQLDLTPFQVH